MLSIKTFQILRQCFIQQENEEEKVEEEGEKDGYELEFVIDDWGEKESVKSWVDSPVSPMSPVNKREVTFSTKDTVHEFDKDKELGSPVVSRGSTGLMSKFKDMMAKPPVPRVISSYLFLEVKFGYKIYIPMINDVEQFDLDLVLNK